MKRVLFSLGTFLLAIGLGVGAIGLALPTLRARFRPLVVGHLVRSLGEREKRQIYLETARRTGSFFDVLPEPEVGRIGRPGVRTQGKRVEYRLNNLGFRSGRSMLPREGDRGYRIVLLGDSHVYGLGVPEGDRLEAQLEAYLGDLLPREQFRDLEIFSLALPSWNLIQEATFLRSRLGQFRPDLILMLACGNDLEPASGVTGSGRLTRAFSPEQRHLGSGVFRFVPGEAFGDGRSGALRWDLSHAGRSRWGECLGAVRRLGEAQRALGGRMLLAWLAGVSPQEEYFSRILRSHAPALAESGVPLLRTSYFPERGSTILGNGDTHASAEGYRILASHFLHVLARRGWPPWELRGLPPLDGELDTSWATPPGPEELAESRDWALAFLGRDMDFRTLRRREEPFPAWTPALLGGILPPLGEGGGQGVAPWASVQAGFLMERPEQASGHELVLDLGFPPRAELFPLSLTISLDGRERHQLLLEDLRAAGPRRVRIPLPPPPETDLGALEVILRTSSYICDLDDPRMRSYQLHRARILPVGEGTTANLEEDSS